MHSLQKLLTVCLKKIFFKPTFSMFSVLGYKNNLLTALSTAVITHSVAVCRIPYFIKMMGYEDPATPERTESKEGL